MEGDITKKPPLFLSIVGTILLFSLMVFGKNYFFNSKSDTKALLKVQIDSLNKFLPYISDDSISSDTVFILKNGNVKYCYTLLKVDDKTAKIYLDALRYKLKSDCQKFYESDEGMGFYRNSDIKINYNYNDKIGNYLFDFTVESSKK